MIQEAKKFPTTLVLITLINVVIFYPFLFNEHVQNIRDDKSLSGYFSRYLSLFYQTPPVQTFMTASEVIRHRGYPVEEHTVTSEDGYILTLFRIPHGKFEKESKSNSRGNHIKEPVVFHHGVMGSADHWLILPPDQALAFMLADAGKDVWIASSRGTHYSSKHLHLSPDDLEFWNFTFDEQGKFDVPAIINYILKTTKAPKLSWVGHSMGCCVLLVALSQHPQLHDKVDKMVGLAPGVYLFSNAPQFFKICTYFSSDMCQKILNTLNKGQMIAPIVVSWLSNYGPYICSGKWTARVCHFVQHMFVGYNWNGVDESLVSLVPSRTISGASGKTLVHFAQLIHSEGSQAFDYGPEENMRRYNSSTPQIYDMTKIKVKTILFYSLQDCLVYPATVKRFANELENLVDLVQVSDPSFVHNDFLFGKNAKRLVYQKAISFLKQT